MFLYQTPLFIDSLEKKLMTKTVYEKYLIRFRFNREQDVKDVNSLTLLDNNSNFYTSKLNVKYFKKNYFKKKTFAFTVGFSLSVKTFIYQTSNFQFKFYLLNSKSYTFDYLNLLLKKLFTLRSQKKILFLIRPCRGGVTCFFNGICGYFPRRHILYTQNKDLNFAKLFSLSRNSFTNLNFTKILNNRACFLFFLSKMRELPIRVRVSNTKKVFLNDYIHFYFRKKKLSYKLLSSVIYSFYKKLNAYKKKKIRSYFFFTLNRVIKNTHNFLPKKANPFLYFNLTLKLKKRYFNAKRKRKIKRWRKRLFKSRFKIIFLSYLKKNIVQVKLNL